MLLEVHHEWCFPLRRMKQNGRRVQEHSSSSIVLLSTANSNIVEPELLRLICTLHRARLNSIKFYGSVWQDDACYTGPKTREDHSFEQSIICRIDIERWSGWRTTHRNKVEGHQGVQEVGAKGRDVSNSRLRDEVLNASFSISNQRASIVHHTSSQKARTAFPPFWLLSVRHAS